jgi:hypothetical protein
MEQTVQSLVSKRLAYRLADHLPKPLKIAYYIILWATAIYVLYRFLRWLLETIQEVGEFMFEKRNYWTTVWVIFVMAVGSILIAQFWYGLDPVGHTIRWFENLIKGWITL